MLRFVFVIFPRLWKNNGKSASVARVKFTELLFRRSCHSKNEYTHIKNNKARKSPPLHRFARFPRAAPLKSETINPQETAACRCRLQTVRLVSCYHNSIIARAVTRVLCTTVAVVRPENVVRRDFQPRTIDLRRRTAWRAPGALFVVPCEPPATNSVSSASRNVANVQTTRPRRCRVLCFHDGSSAGLLTFCSPKTRPAASTTRRYVHAAPETTRCCFRAYHACTYAHESRGKIVGNRTRCRGFCSCVVRLA